MTTETSNLEKTYTAEEFMALPDNGKQYELIKGELVEIPSPSYSQGKVINNLSRLLGVYVKDNSVGELVSGTAFILGVRNVVIPDVAFVASERLTTDLDYFDAFHGAPDLAVEVVSRTDNIFQLDEKVEEYLKVGVRLVWVINPRSRLVFVYQPNSLKPLTLGIEDELTGETVIPGFKLLVKRLFE
jgi:Uma2 family endonuclease